MRWQKTLHCNGLQLQGFEYIFNYSFLIGKKYEYTSNTITETFYVNIFIRFDFKILARGETDAGYYYEGNDFSQVIIEYYTNLLLLVYFWFYHDSATIPFVIDRL